MDCEVHGGSSNCQPTVDVGLHKSNWSALTWTNHPFGWYSQSFELKFQFEHPSFIHMCINVDWFKNLTLPEGGQTFFGALWGSWKHTWLFYEEKPLMWVCVKKKNCFRIFFILCNHNTSIISPSHRWLSAQRPALMRRRSNWITKRPNERIDWTHDDDLYEMRAPESLTLIYWDSPQVRICIVNTLFSQGNCVRQIWS